MNITITKHQTKLSGIILALVIAGLISVVVLAQSVVSLKFEAESGTALSGASVVGDNTASGGNHLAFGTVASSNSFFEDFTGDTSLNSLDYGVWHRDPHLVDQTQWPGDHESHAAGDCGGPTTSRTVHRTWNGSAGEAVYLCQSVDGDPAKAHIMTSIGDTSGYSIGWFSPKTVFSSVNSIKFNVNLTNLGARKWWKVGVLTEAQYKSTQITNYGGWAAPGLLASDVGSSSLANENLANANFYIVTWSGQASAGWPGGYMKMGNSGTGTKSNPSPTDKATRYPVSLVDNKNGTLTFLVNGVAATSSGVFPTCPCRVVFYDHNYTPNKSDPPSPVSAPYTWHWDNLQVN